MLANFFYTAKYKDSRLGQNCFLNTKGLPDAYNGEMQLYGNDGWQKYHDLVMRVWFRANNSAEPGSPDAVEIKYVLEFFDEGTFWSSDFWPSGN